MKIIRGSLSICILMVALVAGFLWLDGSGAMALWYRLLSYREGALVVDIALLSIYYWWQSA